MNITLLSDLHFEFHRDGGASFTAHLDPDGVDVLVLAGDIAVGKAIPDAMALLCRRFEKATVVYVHGNHEFYGHTRDEVLAASRAAERACPNLRVLDKEAVSVGGQRFLGAPLWFPSSPESAAFKLGMSDFRVIRGFEEWVYDENAKALAWLDAELREGDVVVTHYLPSQRSVAPEYESSPLNPFFVCPVDARIIERRPALWLHGHTHASMDYRLEATRVVCNPFGYARQEENPRFDPRIRIAC